MVSSSIGINVFNFKCTKKIPRHSRILNTIACENAGEDARKIISEFAPDLIGIRALSICAGRFKAMAEIIRQEAPKTPLIERGPILLLPIKDILASPPLVDLVVIGEGEITFVELLTCLQDKGSLPSLLVGAVVQFQGQVQINESRPTIG